MTKGDQREPGFAGEKAGTSSLAAPASITVRSVLVLGLLGGFAQLAARLAGESERPARWASLLLLYAALMVAALYAFEFVCLLRGAWRRQCTVLGLLDVTTAFCLWLGAVHWTIPPDASGLQLLAFCGLISSASVSLAACMACRHKTCALALLVLLLACPLLAVLLGKTDIPPASTRPLVILVLAQYAGLCCSLLTLRIAGYRMGWARPPGTHGWSELSTVAQQGRPTTGLGEQRMAGTMKSSPRLRGPRFGLLTLLVLVSVLCASFEGTYAVGGVDSSGYQSHRFGGRGSSGALLICEIQRFPLGNKTATGRQ